MRRSAGHGGRADRLARTDVPELYAHRHHGPTGLILRAQLRHHGAAARRHLRECGAAKGVGAGQVSILIV